MKPESRIVKHAASAEPNVSGVSWATLGYLTGHFRRGRGRASVILALLLIIVCSPRSGSCQVSPSATGEGDNLEAQLLATDDESFLRLTRSAGVQGESVSAADQLQPHPREGASQEQLFQSSPAPPPTAPPLGQAEASPAPAAAAASRRLLQSAYVSCLDIKLSVAGAASGTYSITPSGKTTAINVYCDMTTDGGGYTYYPCSVRAAPPPPLAPCDPPCAPSGHLGLPPLTVPFAARSRPAELRHHIRAPQHQRLHVRGALHGNPAHEGALGLDVQLRNGDLRLQLDRQLLQRRARNLQGCPPPFKSPPDVRGELRISATCAAVQLITCAAPVTRPQGPVVARIAVIQRGRATPKGG